MFQEHLKPEIRRPSIKKTLFDTKYTMRQCEDPHKLIYVGQHDIIMHIGTAW